MCLCVRGGGGGGGEFHLGWGYVHVVKFMGGLRPRCKIHRWGGGVMSTYQNALGGGDYVHLYKNELWDFCLGDIVRIPSRFLMYSYTFS